MKLHTYEMQVEWTGNDGVGTQSYKSYRRDHAIHAKDKPSIVGSSDPHFRGDPARYNPEELLVASLSSCHMLWYLHLCAMNQISVVGYEDSPVGTMEERADGSGEFVSAELKPRVQIAAGDLAKAVALHHDAHRLCFIANSVKFPVSVTPEVVEAATAVR